MFSSRAERSRYDPHVGRRPTADIAPLKTDEPTTATTPIPELQGTIKEDLNDSTDGMRAIHVIMGVLYFTMVVLVLFAGFSVTNDSVLSVSDLSWLVIHAVLAFCFASLFGAYMIYFFVQAKLFERVSVRLRAWRAIQACLLATAVLFLFTLYNSYLWQIGSSGANHDVLRLIVHSIYVFFVPSFGLRLMDIFLFDLAALKA